LNANRLENKQRAQRGMTLLILTSTFFMAAKKLNLYGEKKDYDFSQKHDIQISVKNESPTG